MINVNLKSPAKINLFLHITEKVDNYHKLQTLMQFIDLHDQILFTKNNEARVNISTNNASIKPEDNIINTAVNAIKKYANNFCGIDINLNKKIPIGAGLGGGSSNAATTIMALNEIWDCRLNKQQLIDIAINIGSDVPFFVHGESAFVEGFGEQISSYGEIAESPLIIVYPNQEVSTKAMFSAKHLIRNETKINKKKFNINKTYNAFEKHLLNEYPKIKRAHADLSKFGKVKITGSGSCIYVTTSNEEGALEILKNIDTQGIKLATTSRNKSPLLSQIQSLNHQSLIKRGK